jgi:hypothetical protein
MTSMTSMTTIHVVIVFVVVLFIYIHVQFQLSASNKRDVYVLDGVTRSSIEDILDMKQPTVFNTFRPEEQPIYNHLNKHNIQTAMANNDIQICDNTRTVRHTSVPSMFTSATKLFNADTNAQFYTEKNDLFMQSFQSNPLLQPMQHHHTFLVPPLQSTARHDLLFGADKATSLPQHSIMYRNFFTVTSGALKIKLVHPSNKTNVCNRTSTNSTSTSSTNSTSTSTGKSKNDYFHMRFFTDIDMWTPSQSNNTDIIEATIQTGETISIPPYWTYSFQFDKDTVVCASAYNSYITDIVTIHHKILHLMHKFTRTDFNAGVPLAGVPPADPPLRAMDVEVLLAGVPPADPPLRAMDIEVPYTVAEDTDVIVAEDTDVIVAEDTDVANVTVDEAIPRI